MKENGQLQQLNDLLRYLHEKSPFYQNHLSQLPKQLESLNDIKQFPFTTKEDLAKNNEAFRCIDLHEIAEIATTSGTSGEPVNIFLHKDDLARLAENEKNSFELIGAKSGDLFQLMTTMDKQFMAGLAYYMGTQALGAGIIRIGPGVPQLQWRAILQYKPKYIIAVPSFLVTLIAYAKQQGIDLKETSVKGAVCIGEPIREDDLSLNILGKRITQDWPIDLYSTYASTEMAAAFTECSAHQGGHLNEDLIYLEVLDENNTAVASGETGEIVISTLGLLGTPLLRYRTGDVARVYREKCACGRTSLRLGPILGRMNQMIKFKGTTIYPPAIYEIFDSFDQVTCYKIEISKDELNQDLITILLDKTLEYAPVFAEIKEACKAKLRVMPHFIFLEPDYLRSQVFKNHMRKPEKIVFK